MIPGVKRPCLDCGTLTDKGSRCPPHQAALMRRIDQARGPREHYAGDYKRRAAEVRANAIECHWCHGPFTPANPVQADHVVPRDPDSVLVPSCRRCNIARSKSTTN